MELTQKRLKYLVDYNPFTGVFIWKKSIGSRSIVGEPAGNIMKPLGYRQIRIDKKLYYSHRLAWLYMYGEFPKHQIDHINHDRADNRINNLRDCTQADNKKNIRKYKNNTSGVTGVHWCKKRNEWTCAISGDGKVINGGRFKNKEDAILKREALLVEYKYHENHGV